MSLDSLDKLFLEELRDMYNGEKQITRALPKMAKAADSPELGDAFTKHLRETEGQIQRLEQIFQELGQAVRGKTCKGIQGILEEGKEMLEEDSAEPVLDAAPDFRRPEGRALRDRILRLPADLRPAARLRSGRAAAGAEPGRGRGGRPEADRAGRGRDQRGRRVGREQPRGGGMRDPMDSRSEWTAWPVSWSAVWVGALTALGRRD